MVFIRCKFEKKKSSTLWREYEIKDVRRQRETRTVCHYTYQLGLRTSLSDTDVFLIIDIYDIKPIRECQLVRIH